MNAIFFFASNVNFGVANICKRVCLPSSLLIAQYEFGKPESMKFCTKMLKPCKTGCVL